MTALAAIVLAALLFEDDDFFVAGLLHNFCFDNSAWQHRRTGLRAILVRNHQNFIQQDGIACFCFQLFNADNIVFGDTILFAARLHYCEHGSLPSIASRVLWCHPENRNGL